MREREREREREQASQPASQTDRQTETETEGQKYRELNAGKQLHPQRVTQSEHARIHTCTHSRAPPELMTVTPYQDKQLSPFTSPPSHLILPPPPPPHATLNKQQPQPDTHQGKAPPQPHMTQHMHHAFHAHTPGPGTVVPPPSLLNPTDCVTTGDNRPPSIPLCPSS